MSTSETDREHQIPEAKTVTGDDGEIVKTSFEDLIQRLRQKDFTSLSLEEKQLIDTCLDYKASSRRDRLDSGLNFIAFMEVVNFLFFALIANIPSLDFEIYAPEYIQVLYKLHPYLIVVCCIYLLGRISISYVDDTVASREAREEFGISYIKMMPVVVRDSISKSWQQPVDAEYEVLAALDNLNVERPEKPRKAANNVLKSTQKLRTEQKKQKNEIKREEKQRKKKEESTNRELRVLQEKEVKIAQAKLRLSGDKPLNTAVSLVSTEDKKETDLE